MALLDYKDRFGDCDVPSRFRENEVLSRWVSEQRRLYKKGILLKRRQKRLEQIGFSWVSDRSPEEMWEASFQDYIQFVEHHGPLNVPRTTHYRLYLWVIANRKFTEKLENWHKTKLRSSTR